MFSSGGRTVYHNDPAPSQDHQETSYTFALIYILKRCFILISPTSSYPASGSVICYGSETNKFIWIRPDPDQQPNF